MLVPHCIILRFYTLCVCVLHCVVVWCGVVCVCVCVCVCAGGWVGGCMHVCGLQVLSMYNSQQACMSAVAIYLQKLHIRVLQ